jgi:hypothetical protein
MEEGAQDGSGKERIFFAKSKSCHGCYIYDIRREDGFSSFRACGRFDEFKNENTGT